MSKVPTDAVAVKLFRISGERLIACETVRFTRGADAIDTVFRRASISGRVEFGGEIKDHFADIRDDQGCMVGDTVALDAGSYRILKNRWMRCKTEPS